MADEYNISPKAIAEQGTEGGPEFVLSKTEWISIQTYVNDGLALPTTDDEFRTSLGSGAPSDLSDFEQLIQAYQKINQHCVTWQSDTLPQIISLASDVSDYGANKVPTSYPAINNQAQILNDHPDDEQAKQTLKAILDDLQKTAQGYADNASIVFKAMQQFATDTQADNTTLVGQDGQGGLVKYYNDKYGEFINGLEELIEEMNKKRDEVVVATGNYIRNSVIDAKPPVFVWYYPFGTVGRDVADGLYGDRAVSALDRAQIIEEMIDALKLSAYGRLLIFLFLGQSSLTSMAQHSVAALPAIQKTEGAWGAIPDDLRNILALVDGDIRQALPIIMNLGVDEAINAWHDVASSARNCWLLNRPDQHQDAMDSMLSWRQTFLSSTVH